jgi:hypothetical protein
MMNALAKLSINRKISAIFADGTSKMNLGVSTVVGLLSAAYPVDSGSSICSGCAGLMG